MQAQHADGRTCIFPAEASLIFFSGATQAGRCTKDIDGPAFPAQGRKHADCIELCDRDTSTWCQVSRHAIAAVSRDHGHASRPCIVSSSSA